MTVESLLEDCEEYHKAHPQYRQGQAVFNYMDEKYGVARKVQFIDNIDCFYDNDMILPFLVKCLETIRNNNE